MSLEPLRAAISWTTSSGTPARFRAIVPAFDRSKWHGVVRILARIASFGSP